jgi:palmitoyltransferase
VSNLVNSAFRSSDVWPSSPVASSADQPLKVAENGKKKGVKDWREVERPMPRLGTGPRWCRFCEINKPDRTHHCRHCGTCVMQFDRE